ncbi:MAG: hypothetical protein M3P85_00525, partial [Actinomycetota bacterium]|nr:hypothetical protein [Actinomycetota bacterium]
MAHNDESTGDDVRPGVAELAVAAVGVGLQLATGDEAGTVVGGIVPPALLLAYRLDVASRERRAARAARTLEVATDDLGVDLPGLERLALRDDGRASLVARVMAASANAVTAQEKVEVLGHVLATGLGADDRLDEALLLAAALDDLEAPHVRTLTSLGEVAF